MLGIILDIILIILKITGILILAILGLVVVLTLVILFVPIRYKSIGDFEKDEGFKHHIYAKVTWCLHIVSVTFSRIENKNDFVIKIFGINIDKFKKKPQKSSSKKKNRKNKDTKTLVKKDTKQNTDHNIDKPKENKVLNTSSDNTTNKTSPSAEKTNSQVNIKRATEQSACEDKKIGIFDKIKLKIKAILDKIQNICEKIKKYDHVKNSFIEYLRKDESKTAIKKIKKISYKLIKHILPRKLKANLGFGFEDPSTTGTTLGALSMLYVIYGDNLELEPDFDKQVLYGKYKLKGRIYIYFLLIVAWKLYKDEWIKNFVAFSKKTVKDL